MVVTSEKPHNIAIGSNIADSFALSKSSVDEANKIHPKGSSLIG